MINNFKEKLNSLFDKRDKIPACYAPFTSMLFDQQGRVTTCYCNHSHHLGIYPENTIKECWFGNQANDLREKISNHDYSNGCFPCAYLSTINKDITYSTNYDSYEGKVRIKKYSGLSNKNSLSINMPKEIGFTLSNICNLECKMCDGFYSSQIRANREKLPNLKNPYDKNFLEELKYFLPTLEKANFAGGEPFLIDMNYKIWELLYEMNPNIYIHVNTNATILTQRVKKILNKLNFNISLSIDSIEKENYERIRKNASFEKIIENLEYFLSYHEQRNRKLNLLVCPIQQNWTEIPNIIEFCNGKNIYVRLSITYKPSDSTLSTLDADNLTEIIDYWSNYELPANNIVEQFNKIQLKNHIDLISKWKHEKEEGTDVWESLLVNEYLSGNFEERSEFNRRYLSDILNRNSSKTKSEDYNLFTKKIIDNKLKTLASNYNKKTLSEILSENKK